MRASFAEKEAKLKLEQAEREAKAVLEKARADAELETLARQREAEAASRQADVLEAAEEQVRAPDIAQGSVRSLKTEREDRTSAYVREQSELHVGTPSGQPEIDPSAQNAAILHEVHPRPPGLTSTMSLFLTKGNEQNEDESRVKPQLPNVAHSAQAHTSLRHANRNLTPAAQLYSSHRLTGRNITPSAEQYTSYHHTYRKMNPSAQPYMEFLSAKEDDTYLDWPSWTPLGASAL